MDDFARAGRPATGPGRSEVDPAAGRVNNRQVLIVFLCRSGRQDPSLTGRTELSDRKVEHDKTHLEEGGGEVCRETKTRPPATLEVAKDRNEVDWLDELITKVWRVESGDQLDPPAGDNGKAVGPLQLHTCVIDDVNRYWRTDFDYADRSDIDKSKVIARLYITMWLEIHREEIAARIFNGGPRGWQKKSTDAYWQKIRAVR